MCDNSGNCDYITGSFSYYEMSPDTNMENFIDDPLLYAYYAWMYNDNLDMTFGDLKDSSDESVREYINNIGEYCGGCIEVYDEYGDGNYQIRYYPNGNLSEYHSYEKGEWDPNYDGLYKW